MQNLSADEKIVIGIIVIVRNEERNIERCLKTIFAQVGVNHSLFISDNNSSDQTVKIVKKYQDRIQELRLESSPVKSPYAHFVNAHKAFVQKNIDIKWWIIIGADDEWIGRDYLWNLFLKAQDFEMRFGHTRPVGILPTVNLLDCRNAKVSVARIVTSFVPFSIRNIFYFLIPRSWQPLCFYFSLWNYKAIELLSKREMAIELARLEFNSKWERSPEFETLFSLTFIKEVQLISSKSSIYLRRNFNRSIRLQDTLQLESARRLGILTFLISLRKILYQCFYMKFYLKAWKNYLPLSMYLLYWFLFPLQVTFEIMVTFISGLKRKAL